tara:strand:+ start:1303 stop:1410 length:108 start_codon:yes stop_codon:yes gene_type:complete
MAEHNNRTRQEQDDRRIDKYITRYTRIGIDTGQIK